MTQSSEDSIAHISRREFIKTTALATVAAAATQISFAQTAPASGAVSQRLLAGWEHYRGSLGGIWEVWRGGRATEQTAWQAVAMPHCFNARDAVDPDESYYQGPGWYRTKLKLPPNPFPEGRTLLHFEGAGQKTEVFIDLDSVGRHVGGYDEFIFDITEAAAKILNSPNNKGGSEVPLAIRCDNSRDLEMIPSPLSDFNLYGGLYRYVNLVYVPAVSLERVHISPTLQSQGPAKVSLAKISIKARLYNPAAHTEEVKISVRVLDPKGKAIRSDTQVLAPWGDERELGALDVKMPELWSPKNPALYSCEVTLSSAHGEMSVNERFGIRSYEFVDHGPFKLNGERLLLRGTTRHEDHAGLGSAMPEELVRKELQMIKDVGANFIRLGHYQQSRIVLNLCDELGLMVWEEAPWCRSGIGGEAFQQQAHAMLRNMIDQHYNHPAVIIWGLGNEDDWPTEYPEQDQEKIRSFMTGLRDLAHSLDASRKTGVRRCAFAKDIPDVYSPSIWAGWYRGRYTDYKNFSETEMKQVNHFIHMEWGGDSHARRHSEDPDRELSKIDTAPLPTDPAQLNAMLSGGVDTGSKNGDWSESYICNLMDWHLKEQETLPWLTGAAQWIFKDFSTPGRPENPVPRVNQKGMVERDLVPKESYYVFQSYWNEKPMAHIYGHSWPIRWGEADEEKMVKVYSNCDTAELFLNGVSCGVKKRNSQNFPAAGLRWRVKFQSGENNLRAVAHKNGIMVNDEINFQYQTEKWEAPAQLELKEISRQDDTVTIQAVLRDAKGVHCVDSRSQVRFGLDGDGALLDNLGTSTGSRVVELYNGRAVISLVRNGGKSVASVSSKGIPTAFLTVG
ncbi:MAG TPA: glycoside hydrolase family 2 TIM barrel-domain containing protein [Terriglobales bacterium]|jgi:beta-galactosidase|nr:glycoside hydrolase family 2 TIM barrel-domain containing protein [Terriglobales bacterium]